MVSSVTRAAQCPTQHAQKFSGWSHFGTGDVVLLKLTGEKLVIISELEPDPEEDNLRNQGQKYLTRTVTHTKKPVFACEICRVGENGIAVSSTSSHK